MTVDNMHPDARPSGCPAHATSEVEWPAPEATACPYPFYTSLRDEQPVYKLPNRNEYLVTRWEDAVEVARNPDLFSHMINQADPTLAGVRDTRAAEEPATAGTGSRYTPYGMASSDPPEHGAKRALGMRLFTRERMTAYEPMIRRHVDNLIDSWIERGSCDFRSQFSDLLPTYVVADALGLPLADAPFFLRISQNESQGARYLSRARIDHDAALFREGAAYLRTALLSRQAEPRDDFLSELVHAQIERDGVFDIDYLVAESLTLLLAGNVTTAHMLASTMMLLLQRPDVLAEVSADHGLIPGLVEESLRIESPLQWQLRVCRKDTELGGVPIPAGAFVVVLYGSANRDERRFEAAGEFDLRRPQLVKHTLAFGHGPHRCLGAPLARLEGRIAFEQILARLSKPRIDLDASDLSCIESTRFRAPKRLVIEFEPTAKRALAPA
jgi:cytochrome P450